MKNNSEQENTSIKRIRPTCKVYPIRLNLERLEAFQELPTFKTRHDVAGSL